jgi:hypothetical protein
MNHSRNANREDARKQYEELYRLPGDKFLDKLLQMIRNNALGSKSDNRFRTPLWGFTRIVKGYSSFRDKSGEAALGMVECWLKTRSAIWEDFPGVYSTEDAQVEFLRLWEIIQFGPNETPLEVAFERAKANPVAIDTALIKTNGYQLFISLAFWLQKIIGEYHNIYLPCRQLAVILSCEPRTISRYRQFAIKDKFLKVEKNHSFNSRSKSGEATEFRFNLGLFTMDGHLQRSR